MISCRTLSFLVAFPVLLLQLPVASADDGDGDVFGFVADLNVSHDDNLFLLAPSVDPATLGLSGKSDTVTSTLVGVDFNKPIGQQRILGSVSAVDSRYQHNDFLDFTAVNYDAKWLWSIGPRWTGEVAVDRTESLNSYADYRVFGVRNKRTVQSENITLSHWYHSDWAVLVGVSRNELTNEQEFLADSDYTAKGYNVGLRYRPRSGNSVIVRAKRSSADYAKRPYNAIAQLDSGYTQTGFEAVVDWQLAAKSKLNGRVEHIDRQHDNFGARDYSGVAGDVSFAFAQGAEVVVFAGYKRTIETYQQLTSSYYVSNEPNVSLKWTPAAKITAGLKLSVGRRDYHGEIAPLPPGFSQRKDKFTRSGLDLAYRPSRPVELKLAVTQEKRNANYDTEDYKHRVAEVSATFHF